MVLVLVPLVGLIALIILVFLAKRAGAVGWIALAAVFVACVITNPDKGKHMSALKEKAMSQARAKGDVGAVIVGGVFGDMLADALEPLVEYRSYGLFSSTSVREKTLTVGVLGQVFVELDKAQKEPRRKGSK